VPITPTSVFGRLYYMNADGGYGSNIKATVETNHPQALAQLCVAFQLAGGATINVEIYDEDSNLFASYTKTNPSATDLFIGFVCWKTNVNVIYNVVETNGINVGVVAGGILPLPPRYMHVHQARDGRGFVVGGSVIAATLSGAYVDIYTRANWVDSFLGVVDQRVYGQITTRYAGVASGSLPSPFEWGKNSNTEGIRLYRGVALWEE